MSTNLATGKSKKHKQLSDVIGYVLNSLQGISEKDENQELINIIFRARQEMLDAQSYFDSVTDTELIDHAIYKMEAAKSQYVYLLKLAKDKGLSVIM
ncbi:MAG: YaaL family protein [Clostridia bacterium]